MCDRRDGALAAICVAAELHQLYVPHPHDLHHAPDCAACRHLQTTQSSRQPLVCSPSDSAATMVHLQLHRLRLTALALLSCPAQCQHLR